jgi:hypothetical protein
MALSLVTETPASAVPLTLYAYVGGGASSPASCPQTTTNSNQCTLTEALQIAASGNIIALASPGTTPYYGNWTIPTAVTIEPATGVPNPTLDGDGTSGGTCSTLSCGGPVLTILGHNVTITGITIQNGNNTLTPSLGGAIDTEGGTVTVSYSKFVSNKAAYGGAIMNADADQGGLGTVSVISSTFTSNTATAGDGGAIDSAGGGSPGTTGSLTVTSSTFTGNQANTGLYGGNPYGGDGGAIDNGDESGSNGALNVSSSAFTSNHAAEGGGAIDNADSGGAGTLTVTGTSFISNSAGDGGAIDNADHAGTTTTTVSTSTFYENTATVHGGGIDTGDNSGTSGSASFKLLTSTLDANIAAEGGGIANGDDAPPAGSNANLTATATTFSANTASLLGNTIDNTTGGTVYGTNDVVWLTADLFNGSCSTGTVVDGGYNAGSDATCENGGTGDVHTGTFPTLTLANNGGPTETIAIGSGDPAYQVIPHGTGSLCPATDQRGGTTGSAACDAGSFQSALAQQTISFTQPTSGIVGDSATLSATGGASGQPVVFTVDQSSGPGVCNVTGTNGTTVNYTAIGNCIIDANQAGGTGYAAANQVPLTIASGLTPQTISFTGPGTGLVGGNATLSATGGGSGNPVVFSISPSSAGVCDVTGTNGTTVNYTAAGSCVIDANQAGNATYAAANQVQQTVNVTTPNGGGGGGGGGPVTPPTLTITAPSPTIFVGAAIPTLTPTYSVPPGGTLVTPPTCTTTATSSSPAGNYPVTCSGAVDPTYTIVYGPGTLTIVGTTVTPPPPPPPPPTLYYNHSGGARLATMPVGTGFWVLNDNGSVTPFGGAKGYGGYTSGKGKQVPVAITATPSGKGYWLVSANGTVHPFGDAKPYGSLSPHPATPVVGIASSADGKGYWLVTAAGDVSGLGDAHSYGPAIKLHLSEPIVGIASTPDGKGYWLAEENGVVFYYGDARFYGPATKLHLSKPVVGIAATPDGKGYWLVTEGGGIFNFGNAHKYGSEGGKKLAQPIVGLVASSTGTSYAIVNAAGTATKFPHS